MKILEIVQSLDKGGRTVRFVDTIIGLRDRSISVYPISLKSPERPLKIDDICIIPRHQGYNFSLVWQLVDFIRRHNIDLVHAHCEYTQFYAGIACKLCRIPIVATMHRSDLSKYRPSLLNSCLRYLVDVFVAVSKDRQGKLVKQLSVPEEKTCVVHGGVTKTQQIEEAQKYQLRQQLGIADDQLVLFSLGHLGEIKGHQDTIRALRNINDSRVHLYIAGTGEKSEKTFLVDMVERFKLRERVHFVGQTSIAQTWMQACDIFIQPSLEEAFGLVFIEAGAVGRPVIATRVGGIKEIIDDDQTGILVEPGHPEQLAQAIMTLISDKTRREAMGHNGLLRVRKNFLLEHMINRYQLLFSELLVSNVSLWKKLWLR
ncbi:glycosyltransferase family 4 protein [Thalassotalea mangrovi]|uniref:Glycosyltransferase family 4 protein n=1 Tax=Thalassotalea mangrovi TaxID=2572245 RepID=A0A4U1B806_9GAMM|nr:glycosyltransferase family 4 protein [Thalassotalea mangrovi]TKB46639.1 glycosyltransferase family 4 protein [Thalassotalea mangrovi]